MAMFFPQGLWGFISRRFDLHIFPVSRRLRFLEMPQPAAANDAQHHAIAAPVHGPSLEK
ncbi:hypothetical protein [Paraburkholderia sp. HP33-1]|uniref:hypothetical protein n=1 Tax=Paraburkholderia sp. HP33-1 TaxID=2883243 RepID=UPI001F36F444|nr:hypothetical protein [Paraburkholderia sp. HP33-1]